MKENYQFKGNWMKGSDRDYGKDDSLYYQDKRNIIVFNEFLINSIEKTYLYIATLGYSIITINNQRITEDELNLVWTQFQKCVYYDVYDVTQYLHVGNNEISIELGNGMYNPSPLKLFGKYNLRERLKEVGEPRVICDLITNEDVILSTDASWKMKEGQFLFNNLYLGEKIDLHKLDSEIKPVFVDGTKRHMQLNTIPPIRKKQTVQPKQYISTNEGLVVDFGEMISGFIDIEFYAQDHTHVILQYSEKFENNQMDYHTCLAGSVGEQIQDITVPGGLGAPVMAIQKDEIIACAGKNSYTNTFTYHSFRYVLIQGIGQEDIDTLSAIYVHTDLKQIGTIGTDNAVLNELYDVALRTKLNNVHGIFEDCARERLGYGGDMVALATSNLYTFDLEELYKKIIRDFRYEQTKNGGIPETAPYMGIQSNGTGEGEGPLLWQLVYPYLTYKHYQYYGDIKVLEEEYPYLYKQMQYLLNYDLDKLVHCCLGDHGSMLIAGQFRKPTPDKLFLGYCTLLLFLKYNILTAQIINEDMSQYQKKYDELKLHIIHQFQNKDGTFGEGTQTGFAFAIALQLTSPELLCQKLVEKIEQDQGIFNSGIFGMALTYEVLNSYGYNEIIERWLLQESNVGYLAMLKNGNRALAELFVGEQLSLNHAMFSSYTQWYYQGLAGIQICEDAVGFDKIKLSPYFSKQINHFECTIETNQGMITSSWQRNQDEIVWKIEVPRTIQYQIKFNQDYQIVNQNNQMIIHIRKL
ncbi:family 78 glycoside hydrolase catalytic domain [Coprobacillus cateniformis]|nr:family 78 glycoside hydrolase catalytic domain [Coprobacillus cateniformis]